MIRAVRCTLLVCYCENINKNTSARLYVYNLIEILGYDNKYYELYCLLRKSSHCHTQTFTWQVSLLVKMSVGYGKVASDSAILHGNSILKGFQEAEYYMQ
jgi:hypothetical protein